MQGRTARGCSGMLSTPGLEKKDFSCTTVRFRKNFEAGIFPIFRKVPPKFQISLLKISEVILNFGNFSLKFRKLSSSFEILFGYLSSGYQNLIFEFPKSKSNFVLAFFLSQKIYKNRKTQKHKIEMGTA